MAGLILSGGFGSFSKHYGLATAGLLEAEGVTADGVVRITNACTHPDLFWALKDGGGGSFGVVTRLTLSTRELPAYFGDVYGAIKASSDKAFRDLTAHTIGFYHDRLFNPHIRRDFLRFAQAMWQTYGDVVSYHVAGQRVLHFALPEHAHEILVTQAKAFRRACIGRGFAMMEGPLVPAEFIRQYHIRLADGQGEPELEIQLSLHPKGGIRLQLGARASMHG